MLVPSYSSPLIAVLSVCWWVGSIGGILVRPGTPNAMESDVGFSFSRADGNTTSSGVFARADLSDISLFSQGLEVVRGGVFVEQPAKRESYHFCVVFLLPLRALSNILPQGR